MKIYLSLFYLKLVSSTLKMGHSVIGLRLVQCLITSQPMAITLQSVTEDNLPINKEDRPTPDDKPGEMQGDGPQGNLTSPFFKITGRYITFLIGGGCDDQLVRAEFIVESEVRNLRANEAQPADKALGIPLWFLYHVGAKSNAAPSASLLPTQMQSVTGVSPKTRQIAQHNNKSNPFRSNWGSGL